ncbi:MAG: VTT domain-containing protein [Candidatus Thiodiazotropha sp. (ex Monitilora ramsayi)]|nr:VTT domain-containing protein [Candidatus Thiodiazotropha sp. (ex Monitilora ramsayi)]
MKPLIKLFLIIAACFAVTFLVIKLSGILTIEQIESWLKMAREASPIYVGSIVALLLFADLFIAIPTLTVTILSGYFLGHAYGAVAALGGTMLAGICGYLLSRFYGEAILGFLLRDEEKRNEAIHTFQRHGFAMILLSRAMPILPETAACLSGMTRMPFYRFLAAWSVSTVPYVLIASYAGSVSSINNPKPAIFTAIGISTLLWLAWFIYHRRHNEANG